VKPVQLRARKGVLQLRLRRSGLRSGQVPDLFINLPPAVSELVGDIAQGQVQPTNDILRKHGTQ
jgi:hypothetical protein